jgi:pimeloyl-ACP methyl ester carboxylesterase
MAYPSKLQAFRLPLTIDGVRLDIAAMYRDGTGVPLVFLHGFGSTKEDYADVIQQPALADRPILAYDAPGCGATTCSDVTGVSIPFLVSVASEVLRARQIGRFHIIGHSMGGLTALILANRDPTKIVSFINIEGNLAPEDCFLSRQIISHATDDPNSFLAEFTERAWNSSSFASIFYASSLLHKVRADAVRPIFESMVQLSDHGQLLERFLALPLPKMIMYGEQNNTLSYLPRLAQNGVELAEISHSGHFPMYSNPVEMWSRICDFIIRAAAQKQPARAAFLH